LKISPSKTGAAAGKGKIGFFPSILRFLHFFPSIFVEKTRFLCKFVKFAFFFARNFRRPPNVLFLYKWQKNDLARKKTFGFSRKTRSSFPARSERELGRIFAFFCVFLGVIFNRTSFQQAAPEIEKKWKKKPLKSKNFSFRCGS